MDNIADQVNNATEAVEGMPLSFNCRRQLRARAHPPRSSGSRGWPLNWTDNDVHVKALDDKGACLSEDGK